ncbi:dehydratase [Pseudomaricurvus alkylphenolicus]|jgi:acyl dehydratase|uniref:MaoC/PaaZ C-terminal domain-containing protein n=1 Tax=Pseudomaricurvus alkylphenolicus TaxID=1306991 RepID=UPI00141E84ED|nr:MaoC/PaaZ C-terminal domain-containing protein [Pseudomaricurvus alkylphenolicus]NIB43974.1 dehydratase [Pseudomaricurvus alkylphenolicus]
MTNASDILYWNDFKPGDTHQLGNYYLSQEELIEFARRYDPQPFHIDPGKAIDSPIGCLCASGIQTFAILQRLTVDQLYCRTAVVAGMGVDKLRFLKPVLPDQTLSARITVLKCMTDVKNRDRGIMQYRAEVLDQEGAKVASLEATVMLNKHPCDSEETLSEHCTDTLT